MIWSPEARNDLKIIFDFISRDSENCAIQFIDNLIASTERLVIFSESGRVIPEFDNPANREFIFGAYRVMYRMEDDGVWITGVVHGARDWSPLEE